MKINEILTEDIQQLDEINWKKLAGAATLAGASLFGGASPADAQIFSPDQRALLSIGMEEAFKKDFKNNADENDIIKMAYYLGQIEPFYEKDQLSSSAANKYLKLSRLYDSLYKEKLALPKQLTAKMEKRKGYKESESKVGKVSNIPAFNDLESLFYSVANKKDREATAGMSPSEKTQYNWEKAQTATKNLHDKLDRMIAAGNSPEAQNRLKDANDRLEKLNNQLYQQAQSQMNADNNTEIKTTVKNTPLTSNSTYTGPWSYTYNDRNNGWPTLNEIGTITFNDGTKFIGPMGKEGINVDKPAQIITKSGDKISGKFAWDQNSQSGHDKIFVPDNANDLSKISYLFPNQSDNKSTTKMSDAEAKKAAAKKAAADLALKNSFRADASGGSGSSPVPPSNSKVINYKTGGPSDPKSWNGQVSGQLPNGKGIMTYNNGSMFFGEFENGQPKVGTQASYKKNANSGWITGKLVKGKDGKIQFTSN